MHSAFLVEDSPPARESLTLALAETADIVAVGWAESEIEAVEWLRQHPKPDVVVLDLFLNAGTGLGVLAKIRQMALDLRVVVLTNSATSLLRRSCLLLGAEAVYDKADNLEDFLHHCRNMFAEPAGG
ncbi:response regulator [Xylophilus sp. GOD-11R]|uniref:LytR/AlgR family response regulator transcription factor n=1 Tax=Xylophilus sp. GOD-11R TaxID=3089814 RepID=UPI00298BCB1B|nr:response regulator [Xylophilus sp. GOD-11R]WPB55728.1 response regulator [Xylophilus sp. GOD-11R]